MLRLRLAGFPCSVIPKSWLLIPYVLNHFHPLVTADAVVIDHP
jgi:hypothetical protein